MTIDNYKVVANLPYYITSRVLRHLLEAKRPPVLSVVMVQKEVAERICALPGQMSILAVSVQFYAEPSLVETVPASRRPSGARARAVRGARNDCDAEPPARPDEGLGDRARIAS